MEAGPRAHERTDASSGFAAQKAQIHPHFLFNTLNNLYSLAIKKSEKVPDVIIRLSDILDFMLHECNESQIPLNHELKLIKDYIELNGDVKAKVETTLFPDAMGKLVNIRVNIGDFVRKNQIIAEIDPSKPGMNFALSPVKTTITGTVTSLPIEIGSTVTLQTAIAKVGQLNELEIVTYISEKYIRKMKKGLKAISRMQSR